MGKNKLAKWAEMAIFNNVFQPETGHLYGKDHPVKGKWKTDIFRNSNPIILELGCGKGEYTLGLSARFPDNNYIGVDIKGARMWRGAKTAHDNRIPNVAFLRTRIEYINSYFAEDEIDEIWITFPDPHPGKRNSNKRLTCPWFLNIYRNFLKNDGIVHLKTDNTELFNYTKNLVERNNLHVIFATSDLYSHKTGNDILFIKTHYENLFLAGGMKISYLSFRIEKNRIIEDASPKIKKNDDFFSRIYKVTMQIPPGRVTSYGAIAHYLGSGRSARTVGWALNTCHTGPDFIPAHRVVNRNGLLTGKLHFGNTSTMQQLLENEGIIVEDDCIVNFRERFWDPSTELHRKFCHTKKKC